MKRVSDAIAAVHGRKFTYGSACIVICKFCHVFMDCWASTKDTGPLGRTV
jgi:hypothetical protein